MREDIEQVIGTVVGELTQTYKTEKFFSCVEGKGLPSKKEVIEITRDLRKIFFPGFFGNEKIDRTLPEYFAGHGLMDIYDRLEIQIEAALYCRFEGEEAKERAKEQAELICIQFFKKIPAIQKAMLMDVETTFNGDPSAKSREEVIFSYPGMLAIYIYRVAHELFLLDVPYIPRIMTEYAHSRTGIDIHAGAVIGKRFFIDHGTGVVIGETTVIGDDVKIYQGVTLGALSPKAGQKIAGMRRHPTIQDRVTIYAGATILGGQTVIGEDSTIAGNVFIVNTVPPKTKVSVQAQKLIFKGSKDDL